MADWTENLAEDVIGELEPLLRAGKFDVVDKWLDRDPALMDPVETLAALTITFWGKDKLPNRATFLQRAETALARQLGSERAFNLLENRR